MGLILFALVDAVYSALLYYLSSHSEYNISFFTILIPICIYASVGVFVIRESAERWVSRTIKSVLLVSVFGYFVVGVIISIFEREELVLMLMGITITYGLSFVAYCLIALMAASVWRILAKNR